MKTIVIIENNDNSLKLVESDDLIDFTSFKRVIVKKVSQEVFDTLSLSELMQKYV